MSQQTDVDPAVLRASAGAADGVADTLDSPADKAVKEADTAGGSLGGWATGAALTELSTSWRPALDGLRARLRAGAENLRSSADGHEWNDRHTGKDFESMDTATQATPGVMPAVLRPAGDESHPVGHPSGGSSGGSAVDSSGGPLPDPRTSYGTNMPTYDGNGFG
ncbi:type VII secretion target [Streptomyces sp. CRN 30]|uniref:type VII secretion target n=1 Tax=Streptomyces sp. CRN 30 TaxID=3075613 RepID=UPI002A7F5B26|nr:type VII secretion target [Streptomyces sp. CRN 30]